eukprot:jgi/Bigna1/132511/aug1.18_g7219
MWFCTVIVTERPLSAKWEAEIAMILIRHVKRQHMAIWILFKHYGSNNNNNNSRWKKKEEEEEEEKTMGLSIQPYMVENEVIPDDITITALIQAHAMLRNKPEETNNSVVVSEEEEEQFISTDDDDSVGGSSNHDTDNGVPFAERLTKEEMEMAEKQKGLFDRMNIQIHDNNNDNEVKEEKSHDSSNNNNNNNKQSAVEDNPNPEIFQSFRYKYKEAQRRMTKNGRQHQNVHPDLIELHTDVTNGLDRLTVKVRPTVPHCSVASLIGLCIHLTLSRYLDIDRVKLSVRMAEGSHNQEEDVNAQLADKERVSAALENKALLERLETMMILCGTKS